MSRDINFSDIKIERTFKFEAPAGWAVPLLRPITISQDVKLKEPGVPDGDYTDDFIEEGTTLRLVGAMQSNPVPVTKATVKDNILHMEATAYIRVPS